VQAFLDDYQGGAALATDLANTDPQVWHGDEQLDDPAELARFLARHGVPLGADPTDADPTDADPTRADPTDADLDAVRALRAPLRAAIEAGERAAEGDVAAEDDAVARASALVARGGGPPVLARDDAGRWRWAVRVGDVGLADRVALLAGLGLLGVLRTLAADRFRACASPTCSGVFVDTSRAGRRRYCMPELCGNRANVAAHRARRRAERVAES
jgi:predicted RNA-binding Zn ribbon-like protein